MCLENARGTPVQDGQFTPDRRFLSRTISGGFFASPDTMPYCMISTVFRDFPYA
jgi:hypothetical protein